MRSACHAGRCELLLLLLQQVVLQPAGICCLDGRIL